jgi:hypothetical protein
MAGGLAYLTYVLNEDGFSWYSLIPGFFAFALVGSSTEGIYKTLVQDEAPEAAQAVPTDEAAQ